MLRRRSSASPWRWLLPLAIIVGVVIWWQAIGAPSQAPSNELDEATLGAAWADATQEVVAVEPLPVVALANSIPTVTPFSGVAALFIPRLERSALSSPAA